MGSARDLQAQAQPAQSVMERALSLEAETAEWWTALSFDDGDLALEADPVLTPGADSAELEIRLYHL